MIRRRDNWELERRLQTACLLIITAILAGAAAYWLRAVLIPFVLAVLLYQLFSPIVNFLCLKGRLPHLLSIGVALALSALVLILTSSLITNSVAQLLRSSDLFISRLDLLLDQVIERLPMFEDRFRVLAQRQIDNFGEGLGTFVAVLTNSLIFLLSQSTVVLIFLMFLLFGSPPGGEPLSGTLADIDRKVKNYLQVKTAISVAVGTIVGSILHILGVELAFIFGLMAVVLNFIPSVGSIIATLLPIPMILVSPDMTTAAAVTAIVLPGIIQFTVGNIIEPKLMGDTLNLSPVVILLSLAVWASLWGGVGALLAVPITAVIQILCEKLEFTKPIAAILRGDFVAFIGNLERGSDLPPKTSSKAIPEEYQMDKPLKLTKKY